MGEAIGQLLPFAVGVAVSPMPIVAVVLMLVTRRARTNGPAFLLGWIAGIAIAGAILLAIAGPASRATAGPRRGWIGSSSSSASCSCSSPRVSNDRDHGRPVPHHRRQAHRRRRHRLLELTVPGNTLGPAGLSRSR